MGPNGSKLSKNCPKGAPRDPTRDPKPDTKLSTGRVSVFDANKVPAENGFGPEFGYQNLPTNIQKIDRKWTPKR